jgi:hypothetical protein
MLLRNAFYSLKPRSLLRGSLLAKRSNLQTFLTFRRSNAPTCKRLGAQTLPPSNLPFRSFRNTPPWSGQCHQSVECGIRLHTSRLNPDDVTVREGLPVTTVPRTIADVILSGLPDEHINNAIHEALQRGLVTREKLLAVAQLRGGRVGQVIRHALESEVSP